jgi:hypothetical protein
MDDMEEALTRTHDMTTRSNALGSWIVIAVLLLLLGMAIVYMYVGWETADVDTGQSMSTSGYVAMAFGIFFTMALGAGLMALIFYSNRKGHD